MDWVDKPQNYKGLYGILQLLQGSHLNNFPLKALKLGWVAYHSVEFRLKCLDFPSNQCRKLAPVLSRFCNGLCLTDVSETNLIRYLLVCNKTDRSYNTFILRQAPWRHVTTINDKEEAVQI